MGHILVVASGGVGRELLDHAADLVQGRGDLEVVPQGDNFSLRPRQRTPAQKPLKGARENVWKTARVRKVRRKVRHETPAHV